MNEESHATNLGSPESPCSKSKNNNNTTNKEQDRFLPIANVGRIMKKVIPGNGKISKDAKETVQECVSEFISFVTGEASDKCQREKRKTINGDDIIWAITTLGFEDYVNPLKVYLNKYRELEGEKVNVPKQQRSDQMSQSQTLPPPPQQQQLHHQILLQQHQHDQFQQIDQGLSPYATSVYSSTTNTLIPQPSFMNAEQPFPLPFSPNSIQKNYQHQEQIDSVGHW